MQQQKYGADITRQQFVLLVVALCSGTVIEWFDFTVYSQLSPVITRLFFPSNDPVVRQLAFWAVFAMGFVSRPFGAILFGHIGDAVGRRITMLLSVSCIVFPTVIIGCLPTYQQAGLVAPIIMAVLRFIQGLAVGGEFGSCIVYLIEMAPVGQKGLIASLGVMSLGPGIILGTITVLIVTYACTADQLDLWGWRIPFLLSVVIAPVAILLRRALPEPTEFLKSKQKLTDLRIASIAVQRVTSDLSRQHTVGSGGLASDSRRLSFITTLNNSKRRDSFSSSIKGSGRFKSSDVEQQTADQQQQRDYHVRPDADVYARVLAPMGVSQATAAAMHPHPQLTYEHAYDGIATPTRTVVLPTITVHHPQQQHPPRLSLDNNNNNSSQRHSGSFGIHSPRSPLSPAANSSPFLRSQLSRLSSLHQQQQQQFFVVQQQQQGDSSAAADADVNHDAVVVLPPELENKVAAEMEQVQQVVKRHIPVVNLFRGYWKQLLLMVLFEAVYASSFFVFFSWLPSFLVSSRVVSEPESLWIILIGMVLFTATVPVSGHFLVDRGLPKIWTFMAVGVVIGAVVVPVMLGIGSRAKGCIWVLPPLMLALNGLLAGLMTSIGPQLYEPGVRTSGYNLGHNVSFAIFGGLSPFIVSVLAVGLQNRSYIAAGVVVVITAGLTLIAGLGLAHVAPHVNRTEKRVAETAVVPEAAFGAVNAVANHEPEPRIEAVERV